MLSALLLSLLSWSSAVREDEIETDVVVLDNGKQMTGRVLYEGADLIVMKAGRGELEIGRKQVTSIETVERNLKEFMKRFDALPRGDAAAAVALAQWCQEHDLPHEARNLWLRAALADPTNEETLKVAGGRMVGKKVQLRDEKRWLELDEYRGKKERWRERLHLQTAHFDIETDAELEPLMDAGVQIERHYLRFYDVLASELVLYVFEERPKIRAYANAKDFPEAWTNDDSRAWFQPGENVLHVLTGDPYDMQGIVRAVTDMLLFNACRRSSGKTGQVPGWVAAGISEFFAGTAPSEPFGSWGELGRPIGGWFQLQAQDAKPVKLKTLLSSSLGELRRGPDAAQRTAAAYTLGHFLVRGDDGAHRAAFFEYLRGAWLGKISPSGFLKAIGLSDDELARRWNEHVQSNMS